MTRPRRDLPNFLIVGAEKAGTTWLHGVLARHPDVFVPDVKELHFFNAFDSNGRRLDGFQRGLDWYADQFAERGTARAWGEATPLYFCDPEAPARITTTLPEVRILLVLRNPIARTWSHYRMAAAKGHLRGTLEDRIDARDPRLIARSHYADDLAHWQALVPPERRHVAIFEDLIGPSGAAEVADILAFLDLDPARLPADATTAARNAATGYRSPWLYNASVAAARRLRRHPLTSRLAQRMKAAGLYDRLKRANRTEAAPLNLDPMTRLRLRTLFAPDVARLAHLLGAPPPWSDFRTGGPPA